MDPVYGARARCEISPRKSRSEKIDVWEKVVAEQPNNAGGHAGLAHEYMHEGDLPASDMEKAAVQLDKAIELDSSFKSTLLDFSWHFLRAKEYDRAEKVIRRFIEFDPAPPNALRAYGLRQLARIKETQNKPREAEALQKEADKLDSTEWPSQWLPPEDLYVAPSK